MGHRAIQVKIPEVSEDTGWLYLAPVRQDADVYVYMGHEIDKMKNMLPSPLKNLLCKTIVLKWLLVNQRMSKLMLHEYIWQVYPNAFQEYTKGILRGFR